MRQLLLLFHERITRMPIAIGLAFTSFTAVLPAIDKEKFRTVLYQGALEELKQTAELEKDRKLVVIVRNLQSLRPVLGVPGVDGIIFFEDPNVLGQVKGLHTIDCDTDGGSHGWRKINFNASQLNALLSQTSDIALEFDDRVVKDVESKLAAPAGLVDILTKMLIPLPTFERSQVETHACLYIAGMLHKRSWKPRIATFVSQHSETLEPFIEFERFAKKSDEAKMLWRAWYDHVEQDMSLDDASAKYKASKPDLEYMLSVIKPGKGSNKYYYNPQDTPFAG